MFSELFVSIVFPRVELLILPAKTRTVRTHKLPIQLNLVRRLTVFSICHAIEHEIFILIKCSVLDLCFSLCTLFGCIILSALSIIMPFEYAMHSHINCWCWGFERGKIVCIFMNREACRFHIHLLVFFLCQQTILVPLKCMCKKCHWKLSGC